MQSYFNQQVSAAVIYRQLRVFLSVVVGGCVLLQLALAVGAIPFHSPDIGLVEPNVINSIERVVTGHPLYEDPEQPLFGIVQYSPLYYLLAARMITGLHIDPGSDVWSVYAIARSISFVGWLLTSVVVYLLAIRRLKLGHLSGFVLGSLALIVPSINGVAARPDSIARLLTLVAFCCYLAADTEDVSTRRYAFLTTAVGLGVLAVWFKQTAAPMLAVFAILSVLRRRWIDLAWICGAALACCLLIYLVVAGSLGGGRPFYQNVVTGAFGCGLHLDWAVGAFRNSSLTYGALISVFLATAYLYLTQPARWSRDVTCLLVAGVVPLALYAVNFMKYGIGTNHLYEAITFMTLAIATFWRREAEGVIAPSLARLGLAAAAAAYVALFSLTQTALSAYDNHGILWHPERDRLQIAAQEGIVQAVKAELDRQPGSQMFAYWMPYANVRLFESAVAPQVEIVGSCTYPRRVFDYKQFVTGVESGEIKFVVTESRQRLTSYAGADFRDFEPRLTIGDYVMLARPE